MYVPTFRERVIAALDKLHDNILRKQRERDEMKLNRNVRLIQAIENGEPVIIIKRGQSINYPTATPTTSPPEA